MNGPPPWKAEVERRIREEREADFVDAVWGQNQFAAHIKPEYLIGAPIPIVLPGRVVSEPVALGVVASVDHASGVVNVSTPARGFGVVDGRVTSPQAAAKARAKPLKRKRLVVCAVCRSEWPARVLAKGCPTCRATIRRTA